MSYKDALVSNRSTHPMLEGRKVGREAKMEDGASNPHRVLALWRSHHVALIFMEEGAMSVSSLVMR
jgi:hypothetical protein